MNSSNHFRQPTGSRYLFREAFNCLRDALYCLLFIELPDWWGDHKETFVLALRSILDILIVFAILIGLSVCYWIVWFLYFIKHP